MEEWLRIPIVLLEALRKEGVTLETVDPATILAIAKAVCSVASVVCPIINKQ